MPVAAPPQCCCKAPVCDDFCYGCYPNIQVSPITVKIEKKPRYPPPVRPNIKPLNLDRLFPAGPGSTVPPGISQAGAVPCQKCAKILQGKEIQLVRKEQELFQLQRYLRQHGGKKHDYGSVREVEFQLRKRDQEITLLNMSAAKYDSSKIYTQALENPTCATCTKRLRKKEEELRRIEQEVVRQMASPYIKISPNPCDCCTGAVQPKTNEKQRKKNQNNCFKALKKREKELRKKEKDIDKKILQFRKENLEEAKENLEKTPDSFIKEVYLNCKCACKRTGTRVKNFDPCSYDPNAMMGSWACTMPFPMWNGSMSPQLHNCTTKCCVMKLIEGILGCYCNPRFPKKKKNEDTCAVMKLLRWWVFRKSGKCSKK